MDLFTLLAAGTVGTACVYAYRRWRQDRHLDALRRAYEEQRRHHA